MFFKNLSILGLWTKVALALKGLTIQDVYTGELGYDGPLYDGFLHMTDDMLGPNPMHIYLIFVICIQRILHMTDQFSWSH